MANLEKALKITLKHEGFYANVNGDKGGETYAGISRNNFPNWEGWKIIDLKKPLRHNQRVKEVEHLLLPFYKVHKWDKIKGDQIQDQKVATFLFDFFVHSGYHAVMNVQRIVKVKADGVFGPITLTEINKAGNIFPELYEARKTFLINASKLRSNQKFLEGWLNRINSFL
jgi:lysozyme family protein